MIPYLGNVRLGNRLSDRFHDSRCHCGRILWVPSCFLICVPAFRNRLRSGEADNLTRTFRFGLTVCTGHIHHWPIGRKSLKGALAPIHSSSHHVSCSCAPRSRFAFFYYNRTPPKPRNVSTCRCGSVVVLALLLTTRFSFEPINSTYMYKNVVGPPRGKRPRAVSDFSGTNSGCSVAEMRAKYLWKHKYFFYRKFCKTLLVRNHVSLKQRHRCDRKFKFSKLKKSPTDSTKVFVKNILLQCRKVRNELSGWK